MLWAQRAHAPETTVNKDGTQKQTQQLKPPRMRPARPRAHTPHPPPPASQAPGRTAQLPQPASPLQQLNGVLRGCCASLALLLPVARPAAVCHGPSCCWRPLPCPPLLLLLSLLLLALQPCHCRQPCPWQLFAEIRLVLLLLQLAPPPAAVSPACRLHPAAPLAQSPAQVQQLLLLQLPWCWCACRVLGRTQQQQQLLVQQHVQMSGAHGWLLTLSPPCRLAAPAAVGPQPAGQRLLPSGPWQRGHPWQPTPCLGQHWERLLLLLAAERSCGCPYHAWAQEHSLPRL
jgi:hypothetical protein